jgi:hypothetical protein
MLRRPECPPPRRMRRVIVALALSSVLSGCGDGAPGPRPPVGGAGSPVAATSPTAPDPPAAAGLTQRILHRARLWRGNPVALGVVTGALLVVSLGLGLYTLGLAWRGPSGVRGDRSSRAS